MLVFGYFFIHDNALDVPSCRHLSPRRVNSLRPSDALWRHRSVSTLAWVMVCCLVAPGSYLNQCRRSIKRVHKKHMCSEITSLKFLSHPPRSHWVEKADLASRYRGDIMSLSGNKIRHWTGRPEQVRVTSNFFETAIDQWTPLKCDFGYKVWNPSADLPFEVSSISDYLTMYGWILPK